MMKLWYWLWGWRTGKPTEFGFYLVNTADGDLDHTMYIRGSVNWLTNAPVVYWKKVRIYPIKGKMKAI